MTATLTIRPVRDDDLPALASMIAELAAFNGDIGRASIDSLLRDVRGSDPWLHVLIAEESGQPVGYAALNRLSQLQFGIRGMDLHHLYVTEALRGHGIGRRLIAAALDQARAWDCAFVTVGTSPDNSAAQAVYRGCGFTELPSPGPRFRMLLKSPPV